MKINEATIFFITIGLIYAGIGIFMLIDDRPVMTMLFAFVVIICGMIIKIGSRDNG